MRSLKEYQKLKKTHFTHHDITLCFGVRLHQDNLWILDRLKLQLAHYHPLPKVIISDQGSSELYSALLKALCLESGAQYIYDDYQGLYSPARSHNIAAQAVETDFIFFNDPDFFMVHDIFSKLLSLINNAQIGSQLDLMINFIATHLHEESTENFFQTPDSFARTSFLEQVRLKSFFDIKAVADFVAPYSNVFLCRKEGFNLAGGYNENFTGHGSEDFEFLLRFAFIMEQFPLPADPTADVYSPAKAQQSDFFHHRPYRGFRRLFEAMSFMAEVNGFNAFHMHHPRSSQSNWYKKNDWTRQNFNQQTVPYLHNRAAILNDDWLARKKTALVLGADNHNRHFFLALRLAGYKLVLVDDSTDFFNLVDSGKFQAVALFNPQTEAAAVFRKKFEYAVTKGLEPLTIEPGLLPDSWCYASENFGPDFKNFDYENLEKITEDELNLARAYKSLMISPGLEENESYQATIKRYQGFLKHICLFFLPAEGQGRPSYQSFVNEVLSSAADYPDIIFLVKKHPAAKSPPLAGGSNIVICSENEDLKALMDLAHSVLCYNSPAGFLGLLHDKPLYTIGPAFYNLKEFGHHCPDFKTAAKLIASQPDNPPRKDSFLKFLAWLLLRQYSFFATEPQSPEDTSLKLYQLCINGQKILRCDRAALTHKLRSHSYLLARLSLMEPDQWGHYLKHDHIKHSERCEVKCRPVISKFELYLARLIISKKHYNKLLTDRENFFRDSKKGWLKMWFKFTKFLD